jgi:hypothetical protein
MRWAEHKFTDQPLNTKAIHLDDDGGMIEGATIIIGKIYSLGKQKNR